MAEVVDYSLKHQFLGSLQGSGGEHQLSDEQVEDDSQSSSSVVDRNVNETITLAMHYRLRAIRGGPLGLVNFTPHFIVIQIFQILFLSPVSFYTHPNISDIFVGDEIYLFNLTFHDIANY